MIQDSPKKILQDISKLLQFHDSLGLDYYHKSEALDSFFDSCLPQKLANEGTDELPLHSPYFPAKGKAQVVVKEERANSPQKTLADIRRELGDCTRCSLHEGRSRILFGAGPSDAGLMIVGEWPNRADDAEGIFFSGREGELLSKMLQAIDVDLADAYLTNVVKCRASEENPPGKEHISSCRPFLLSQIDVISPKVIVTMGPLAAQELLSTNKLLIRLRGRVHKYKKIPLVPTFQPSYLLKNPEMKKAAWVDLQLLQRELLNKK